MGSGVAQKYKKIKREGPRRKNSELGKKSMRKKKGPEKNKNY
jgi:hypothetical protein